MSQGDQSRRAPPSDLDALLNSLRAEQRASGVSNTPPPMPPDPQVGELDMRRVQALIHAFDLLHEQVGAIASQGETINSLAETQARTTKTLADVQHSMHSLRAVLQQQLQQGKGMPLASVPPLQIKLVVGHLAEQYQQAIRDAAILAQWGVLFIGIGVGAGVAAVVCFIYRLMLPAIVLGTGVLFSLLVAAIFGGLARSARSRAAVARRAMDESSLLRMISHSAHDQL